MAVAPGTAQKPRILTLSDLIFGLALSIGAISLIGQKPATTGEFFTSLGLYAMSFLILIGIWQLYSAITSILPTETPALTSLNIVLLFLVSIEPYIFSQLGGIGSLPNAVSEVYSLDIGFMFLILAVFNHALAGEERDLHPRISVKNYSRIRDACLVNATIFIASAAPFLEDLTMFSFVIGGVTSNFTLRTFMWGVGLVFAYVSHFFLSKDKLRVNSG